MGQLDAALKVISRWTVALGLGAATMVCIPRALEAHAFPQTEDPAVGSTVTSAPAQVSIEFDAPIEALGARLDVLDVTGHNQDEGAPKVGASAHELVVRVRPLQPGEYTVRWGILAEDGHRTEGTYTFTVAGGAP